MPSDSSATRRWLKDILYQIDLAQSFVGDLDYEVFRDDLLRFHAVTRCLEIVSEASQRLPDDVKARHPAIPWKEMATAGNVYRHDYGYTMAMLARAASGRRCGSPCRPCALWLSTS